MLHKNVGFAAFILAFAAGCSSSSGTGVVPVTGGDPNPASGVTGTGGTSATEGGTTGGGGANSAGTGGAADPNVCAPACDGRKACVAGICMTAPTTLTTSADCTTMRLAVKGDTLYFTDTKAGSVRKIPVAGGTASDVVTGQMQPYALVADSTNVYFGNLADMTLKLASLASGSAKTITTETAAATRGLALNGTTLFYGDSHNLDSVMAAEGSTPNVLGVGDDGGKGLPTEIAVDGTNVYYTDANAQGVLRRPQAGMSDAIAMAGSQGDIVLTAILVQAGTVYWANGGELAAKPITADKSSSYTSMNTSVHGNLYTGFTLNGTDVYLGEDGDVGKLGNVETAPLMPAASPKVIAVNQSKPQSFVLDATNVYWVNVTKVSDTVNSCAIMKLPLE